MTAYRVWARALVAAVLAQTVVAGECPSMTDFSCAAGKFCQELAEKTTVVCCPTADGCQRIKPISCVLEEQNVKNKMDVMTTILEGTLPACGAGCCPWGFSCRDEACVRDALPSTISSKVAAEPTSTLEEQKETASQLFTVLIPALPTPDAFDRGEQSEQSSNPESDNNNNDKGDGKEANNAQTTDTKADAGDGDSSSDKSEDDENTDEKRQPTNKDGEAAKTLAKQVGIGVGVGMLLLLGCGILLTVCLMKRNKKKKKQMSYKQEQRRESSSDSNQNRKGSVSTTSSSPGFTEKDIRYYASPPVVPGYGSPRPPTYPLPESNPFSTHANPTGSSVPHMVPFNPNGYASQFRHRSTSGRPSPPMGVGNVRMSGSPPREGTGYRRSPTRAVTGNQGPMSQGGPPQLRQLTPQYRRGTGHPA